MSELEKVLDMVKKGGERKMRCECGASVKASHLYAHKRTLALRKRVLEIGASYRLAVLPDFACRCGSVVTLVRLHKHFDKEGNCTRQEGKRINPSWLPRPEPWAGDDLLPFGDREFGEPSSPDLNPGPLEVPE